jgi:uncharacterized protein YggE
MQRCKRVVSVVLLVVILLLLSGCLQRQPIVEETSALTHTIRVSGSGSVQAQPDVAIVILGVRTEAKEASQALAQNSERMQALLGTLKSTGVAAEDIQTQSVRLWPRYEDAPPESSTSGETRRLVGYSASNVVQVRVRDLGGLGGLIDTAVQAGGNEIQGIRFEIDDPSPLLDRAREAAWQDAQHKAQQLAGLAGLTLGEATKIEASDRALGPVVREMPAIEAARAVPVEPGTQNVEANLTVEWVLY